MAGQNYYNGDGLLNIPGVKFVPEDHHLLQFYLSRKINGEPLPWNGIRDFDIYGEQGPWELIHGEMASEPVYVFAISKNLGPKMKKRTCKFGTWKLQNKNSPVTHQGETIGWKAYLTFYPDKKLKIDPNFLGGSWSMNEYSLPGYQEKEGFVICRVTFHSWTERKRAKRALEETPVGSSHIDATARPPKRTKVVWGEEAPCASASSQYVSHNHSSNSSVVVQLEAPCDTSCYNMETNTVADQLSHASESSYLNCGDLDYCTSSNIVEEQSPLACATSCSDQGIDNTAEIEGPCNFSSYNQGIDNTAEIEGPCNLSSYNQGIDNTAEIKGPCKLSSYNQGIDNTAEIEGPCNLSSYNQGIDNTAEIKGPCKLSSYNQGIDNTAEIGPCNLSSYNQGIDNTADWGDLRAACASSGSDQETNTAAEWGDLPAAYAASCSGQDINNTAELEAPCYFPCYNPETNTVAEQSLPACAPSWSNQEINTTAEHELEGPCNFACFNWETNEQLSPACGFPWHSNLESCTVERQPPSPYALSYYDVVHQHNLCC